MYGRTDLVLTVVGKGVEKWSEYYKEFSDLMMEKLEKNSHKDTPTKGDLTQIMELLRGEIEEFEQQIYNDRFDRNSFLELADIANFAFIAYVAIRLQEPDARMRRGLPPHEKPPLGEKS